MPNKGFEKKTRVEIVDDMKAKAKNLFGKDVNLSVASPLGILITLFSWPISLLWDGLESLYSALSAETATGQDLYNRGKDIAITPIQGQKAVGKIQFSGDNNTLIPAGFRVETDTHEPITFKTTEDAIIENETAIAEIIALEDGTSGNLAAGSITEIVNPLSGVESVNNPEETYGGINRETDSEFRSRYFDSLDRPGGHTVNSIRANVLEETGASACRVLNNPKPEEDVDRGLPPNCYETIVLGGSDQEVAEAIFDKAPGGVEPYGSTVVGVQDDSGGTQHIAFSRAESVDIYINIEVNANGDYPSNGDDQIKDQIIEYIGGTNTEGDSVNGELSISDDVIRKQIVFWVLREVEGINDITYLALGVDPNSLAESNISIDSREVARVLSDDIVVVSQ